MSPMLRRLWGGASAAPRPQTPAELFAMADRLRREGRAAAAARCVADGLSLDPNNLTGHLLAGYLHLIASRVEPARAEFAWVLGRDPTHPRAQLGLARLALEEGDVAAAREALRQALRLYPDFPEAQALLGALGRQRATPAAPPPSAEPAAAPAAPLERLRLPALAGSFVALGPDGNVLAARPDSAAEHGERLARAMSLAAAALSSARFGPPRRGVIEAAEESYFLRADGTLTLALALPRTTQITQGTLEVNRLWAAAQHEMAVRADSARRVS
jgi:tetratricopeptide (TPR) repeat protein